MLDTGVGIEPKRREKVFEAFETTSAPDPILGVGTGLGLKVVRDILDTYGGTARFIDAEEPWRTCIELYLPKEG
jgi:signal transduction histidine kinase